MNVLLFGGSFGCGDIGLDASLAAVVRQFRRLAPGASLAVATDNAAFAASLDVRPVPAFGYSQPSFRGLRDVLRNMDACVWCCGKGLSHRPEIGLSWLGHARKAGVASYVWCVGMESRIDSEALRPASPVRALLRLTGGTVADAARRLGRLERRLATELAACRGVWTRDAASAAELARHGFPDAQVAGDPLFEVAPSVADRVDFVREKDAVPVLGLCLSAPRDGAEAEDVARFVSDLTAAGVRVVGLPLDPAEEAPRMAAWGVGEMLGRTEEQPLPGFPAKGIVSRPLPYREGFRFETSPEACAAFAGECDLVLSDRLAPLVLAANCGTPGWGIGYRTEVDAWLRPLGRATEDDATGCDWGALAEKACAVLAVHGNRSAFESVRDRVYASYATRYMKARDAFSRMLGERK